MTQQCVKSSGNDVTHMFLNNSGLRVCWIVRAVLARFMNLYCQASFRVSGSGFCVLVFATPQRLKPSKLFAWLSVYIIVWQYACTCALRVIAQRQVHRHAADVIVLFFSGDHAQPKALRALVATACLADAPS